jgi:hypothetical protein
MSDEPAPTPTPDPEVPMSTPKRKPQSKRAKPKHLMRYRNATPPALRPSAPRTKVAPPSPTTKEKLVHLGETLAGAGMTSLLGAYAVRWGLAPELVSAGLGIAGGLTTVQVDHRLTRHLAAGAASAAASQYLLLKFNPPPASKPAVASPAPTPPPPAASPRRSADLGALPPGMLDSAFERARAELAVAGDGYPPGYDLDGDRTPFTL